MGSGAHLAPLEGAGGVLSSDKCSCVLDLRT